MRPSKVSRNSAGQLVTQSLFGKPIQSVSLRGYEIHVGETSYLGKSQPFAQLTRLSDGRAESEVDGCITPDTRIFGTYLHGLFDEDSFRHAFIGAAREFYHLAPASELNNWKQRREESLNRLAVTVSQSLDMPKIFGWVGLSYRNAQEIQ
jgi:adenosylcobyric acid synthase